MSLRCIAVISSAVVAVLLAGCHPEPVPANARSSGPITPPAQVRRGTNGPLKMDMSEAEVRQLRDVTVEPLKKMMPDVKGPALIVMQSGLPIALAELEGGKVTRIRYYTPSFVTPEGAHVGSRAQELGKLYGNGRLDRMRGGVCARFDRAPEFRFCFAVPNGGNLGSWDQLLARDPRVKMVIVSKLLPPKPSQHVPAAPPGGNAPSH